MSRIILAQYDNGESKFVVGWDRPLATYYWQHFNKEPEVMEEADGRWRVSGIDGTFATKKLAHEHKWDDWEEMVDFAGYYPNEFPTMQSFMAGLPDKIKPLVTDDVQRLMDEHSMDPDTGSIIVNLAKKEG